MRILLLLALTTAWLTASVAPPTSAAASRLVQREPSDRFGWPLSPRPEVAHRFDPPPHRYGPGHRGVDLVGSPGSPVLAAGAGTVVFTGAVAGRPVLSIDHPNGLRSTYEPVIASIRAGAAVARGAVIGTLEPGHPGCPVPACLHWGLRREDDYLNPLRLVNRQVRLLPPDG
jgi:murein DD-endopeptidase MepM/ murein hydrolase activator NlpD